MATFTSPTLDRAGRAAARISPTSRAFVYTTLAVTLLAFAAAFLISGTAQVWIGAQLGLLPAARLAVPVSIDAPMVAFGLSAIARRARGESIRGSMAWVGAFTASSIAANVWHALATAAPGVSVVGLCLVASLIPIAILATSEQALGVLVAPPSGSAEQRQAIARVADRGMLPGQTAGAGQTPKRGTAEAEDLDATVRAAARAEPGIAKKALADRFGLSAGRVREILNAPATA